MRKIKFRAWDTVNNRFYELIDTRVPELNCGDNDDVVYMQYTGLKDKSGVEIYEGDILRTVRVWHSGSDTQIDTVKWKARYTMCGWWPFFHFNAKDVIEVEIIGNIYENPMKGGDQ